MQTEEGSGVQGGNTMMTMIAFFVGLVSGAVIGAIVALVVAADRK